MPKALLLDTDILIELSRQRGQALKFFEGLPSRPTMSAITITELYAGVREGPERVHLDLFVSKSLVVDVDIQIATMAGLYSRQYSKSHGIGFADAVIAATATVENLTLVTFNRKHFPMLKDILVPYNKP